MRTLALLPSTTLSQLEAVQQSTVRLAARERERMDTKIAPSDDNSSVMMHVDVHRAYFYAQAQPNTRGRAG